MKEFIKLTALLGLLASIVVTGCAQSEEMATNCEGNEILLEESFFSSGATVSPEISPLPEGTKSSVGNTVYLGRGIFDQNVFPIFYKKTSRI